MLFPEHAADDTKYKEHIDETNAISHTFKTKDGVDLHGFQYKHDSSQQEKDSKVILFFHGNDENIVGYTSATTMLRELNYDVFAADYRGYGKSGGKITKEAHFYNDTAAMYEYLLKLGYQEKNIVILGYSLGGASANYIASQTKYKPAGMATIGAFKSIPGAKPRWEIPLYIVLSYHLNNSRKIHRVKCPILIIHGKKDGSIPFQNAEHLFAKAQKGQSPEVKFFPYDGGHFSFLHKGNVRDQVKDKIGNFCNQVTA